MSRLGSRLSVLMLCTLSIFFASAGAQVSASLSGRVTDPAGAAVPGASVTAIDLDTGNSRVSLTDQAGQYQLFELPVGRYELHARKDGFAEKVRTGILLVVGQAAIADVTLQVGEVKQQVTVTENVPIVNGSTQDISGLVGEQQVRDLPLNGRSYDLLLTLNPGIVNFTSQKTGGIGVSNSTTGNNFAVSGNRPQQNLFLLNGVEFTGAAENNMQPGGPSQQLLGVDSIREFNVLRDSYGAEYGKRPGAQVIIVTQSGTNKIHGSAYEFLRNNVLDAPNYFDQGSAPPFQRNQFGASLGGPLKKDKAFLFGNYEGYRQHLHQTSAAFVPDLASRAAAVPSVQPLLNLWPTPPGDAPDFNGIAQVFSSPLQTIREDFGTVRFDLNISPKDTFSTVYTIDDGADYTETIANPYSADILTLREQVLSLDETHVFSPALLNVARFGYSRAGYFFTGEPTPGTPAVNVPGFISGRPVGAVVVGGSAASNPQAQVGLAGSNNGSSLPLARNLYTYEDRVTWSHGRNQWSFGAWFQNFQSNEILNLSQYGQATFASLQTFLAGTTSSFLYSPAPTKMNWRSFFGAVHAQDVIRLNPKLTVSLGFRGEFSTGWNEAHGRAANYTFTGYTISSQPRIGDHAFTENNAKFLPQPRIGLAWNVRPGKTVVRAGFGIYNELLDDLGYRMDQNAPFNPTYSIASLPVSSLPLDPTAHKPAKALLVPGGVQPDVKMPTLISYSLRVEQELTPNTSFTVGYVGSHGYHQLIGVDGNQPVPTVCPASPCPAAYPANFPAPLANSAVPAGSFYIPAGTPKANPTLANTWTWFSWGTANYDSLQVDVNHRFSHDLALRGVYTWSKVLDNGDSLNATTAGNAPGLVSNPYDIHADYGPGTYDVRNIGVVSAVYMLPFGSGKAIGKDLHGFANAAVSGWSVDSIVTIQSGFPITPQLSYNPSNNGDTRNPVRPFVNPNFHASPAIIGTPQQWFNPSAFLPPPANSGFYGNLGRDTLTGPGLGTWDFSGRKDTTIREGLTLQFRGEIFNLLNRANFNTPNLIVFTPSGVSGTAGAITSTSTTSRQVQFALKLLW
ncbi:carboxypeptidase regulatory-like domain-containing protein [Alloacidobacterium dinghuense]|uniref:Carboxypeptidase regulatory-like domain-containing protein n=1 Tax=Alloacidobacterium dinghuense TaxID=2763107 RepID=A0A7G8BDB3_9BACT|nr:carboxypeptidase-like regulatory domain-containing protein [Alloacidobacterium dinghuense]QNI30533.1 carboxypeptidase regulatory-like domain-containing protein [Alloacidobacterium dinghuense]